MIRDDVIESAAHDTGGDDDDGRIPHRIGIAAPGRVSPQRHPHAHEDAGDDAQRIRMDWNGAKMPHHALRRGGDICKILSMHVDSVPYWRARELVWGHFS